MARVAFADDHAIVRKGLRQILLEADDLTLAGEAGSADELLTILRSRPVDVVVLDLSLGTRNGIDVLKHVHSEFPRVRVLMLSMHREELFAQRALRAGASGYIQKERAAEELLEAIRIVAAGGTYFSPELATKLATELVRGAAEAPAHERLSDREFEVFRLLGAGASVSGIAVTLNLSVKTVSTHRTRILEKTGMKTNAEIIAYVQANELG